MDKLISILSEYGYQVSEDEMTVFAEKHGKDPSNLQSGDIVRLVRLYQSEQSEVTDLAMTSTSLAPTPRSRPTSLIAPIAPSPASTPSVPTRSQTLATGTPKPVVKSKLAVQREQVAPVVAQLKQRVSTSQSAAVGQAVGAIQQLRANQEELQNAVAQELALLMSPQAFMDGVMLKTGQIVSQEAAIDVADLLNDVLGGAQNAIAQLAPAPAYAPSNELQAWLDAETEQGTRAIAAVEVD